MVRQDLGMTSKSRRWGVAAFVYLVLAVTVKQLVTEFDAVELAFNVLIAAAMAWVIAKTLDRHWDRSGR
jgi:hypothetical protein